jgi:hypothetical protein
MGLLVVNIKDPTHPRVVARNKDLFPIRVVARAGEIYTVAGYGGLAILNPFPQIHLQFKSAPDPRLIVAGPSGISGQLQYSSDFGEWTGWLPVVFGAAPFETAPIDIASPGNRFYRFIINP